MHPIALIHALHQLLDNHGTTLVRLAETLSPVAKFALFVQLATLLHQ